MPLQFKVFDSGEVAILAKQGEKWEFTLQVTDANNNPVDITNYNIKAVAKYAYQDTVPVFTFNTQKVNAQNGILRLYLLPNETSTIPAYYKSVDKEAWWDYKAGKDGAYVFDIKIYNDTDAIRILEGTIIVDPEVSQ